MATLVPWVATSYQLKASKLTHTAQSKNHQMLGAKSPEFYLKMKKNAKMSIYLIFPNDNPILGQ